ncbi:MAG TPA: hypothetical protein VMT70_09510 [Vicinamibacteria bacterium]|nr:hypothetical protein [Vicinamibacteria bacterium]
MPTPFPFVLGVAVLVGLGVLYVFGRRLGTAFLKYRGTRVVVCPENREMVAVTVDAGHAAFTAPQGRPDLRLESCTRWPEKAGCGQECLGQIASAPEACLLRNILDDWYQGRSCAFCRRSFHALRWHEHQPGLLAPDGGIVAWDGFRAEQVVDVLATHEPVCWDCRVAESFRREHPELVTDRAPRPGPPPSMA